MSRGYFGVGIYQPKFEANTGGLWRSADAFGADFIFTIGQRYTKRQPTDTVCASRHVPLYEYTDLDDFLGHMPKGCAVVPVEVNGKIGLPYVKHPERAVYLLGPEDGSLPAELMESQLLSISIETEHCLNVATTGSLVLYDRLMKETLKKYTGGKGVHF